VVIRIAELLQITTSVAEGRATVRLAGELDLSTSTSVELELERLAREGNTVVIDLHGLDFIDSVGIGLLVRWHARLGPVEEAFRIRGASGQVLQVFQLTAMVEYLGLDDGDNAPGDDEGPRPPLG
jgi:anti-sigma B factor antagonist